jgi:ferredoxin-nitrite reductase
MGHEQGIGREVFRGVRSGDVADLVGKVLDAYDGDRVSGETFIGWSRRHTVGELQELLS